jgi:ribonuclease BN (tRNA processing enzyme)
LGNGGAVNDGLPYNAFVINGTLLCETPPDIMLSIHKNSIDFPSINTIYISHLHGDHIFGLPFLILSAFYLNVRSGNTLSFRIFGPEGLKTMSENLVDKAFTRRHPCFEWMKEFCTFFEVNETSSPDLVDGFQTSLFKLDHLIDTYGFSLAQEDKRVDFAYVADTRWCESLHTVLRNKPRVVLIDLNGEDNDQKRVHLSVGDLMGKAMPLTGEQTNYFGTHLRKEFETTDPRVNCARSGMDINF